MKGQCPKKIFYLSSTHWDREWYRDFQGFRYRLVKTLDHLLQTLCENEHFTTFVMDGQTIALEDYLEIRPENAALLQQLLAQRRIAAGPWYAMPDEYLVSGESLIANLLIGHALCKEYGADAPMPYGYLCDMFGHIAQMPQILNGFQIFGALLGRGTNDRDTPPHFMWNAPDGSHCVTFKVPEELGYGSFWDSVWLPFLKNKDCDKEHLVQRAVQYVESEIARGSGAYVVLMDGMDHEPVHPLAPWLAQRLAAHFSCPVVFEPLHHLSDALQESAPKLAQKNGELCQTAERCVEHNKLIPHTLSSRYDIKLANDRLQTALEKWVQPLSVFAALEHKAVASGFLAHARKLLISCHAHDSICGCSLDRVHQDMHYRFRQVESIYSEIKNDILGGMVPASEEGGIHRLSVFQPLPYPMESVIAAEIAFEPQYASTYCEQADYETINAFRLYDCAGNEVPYTLSNIAKDRLIDIHGKAYREKRNIYRVHFKAALSACSRTDFKIVPSHTPVRYLGTLTTGFAQAENAWTRIKINDNGTLTLTDKTTGACYARLLAYEDDAEIGDGWFHIEPVSNRTVCSVGFPSSIERLLDGPDICRFRVSTYLRVPQTTVQTESDWRRSSQTVEVCITSDITLTSADRFVDIQTTVHNNAANHRLRLCLPTGIAGGEYEAGQAFCTVRRPVGRDASTASWKEVDAPDRNFDGVLIKRAENGTGLAVLSAGGLHECAAWDDSEGTLSVTLFRSFGHTFLTNGEPDGQLQGTLSFHYRLLPVQQNMDTACIIREKDRLQAGLSVLTTETSTDFILERKLPLLTLEGDGLVLSTLKLPEHGGDNEAIVRIVNYSASASSGELICGKALRYVQKTNLLEQPDDNEPLVPVECAHCVSIRLAPWKIVTMKLSFQS